MPLCVIQFSLKNPATCLEKQDCVLISISKSKCLQTQVSLSSFSSRTVYRLNVPPPLFGIISPCSAPQVCFSCSDRRVGFPPELSQSCGYIRRGNTTDQTEEEVLHICPLGAPQGLPFAGASSPEQSEENASSISWRHTIFQL